MTRLRTTIACLAWLALVGVLALGMDDVLAHRFFVHPRDYIPGWRSFGDHVASEKLWAYREQSDRVDVVFAGNSRVLFGDDPGVIDATLAGEGLPRRSFNLGIPGVDVEFWAKFWRDYWPWRMPSVVVMQLSSRDIDARFDYRAGFYFFSSPGFEHRHAGPLTRTAEEALGSAFVLWGRRNEVRALGPRDVLGGGRLNPEIIRTSGTQGMGVFPAKQMRTPAQLRQAAAVERKAGDHLQMTRQQQDALEDVRKNVCAHGGKLVLVSQPVLTNDFGQPGDLSRSLRAYSANTGVPFVDMIAVTRGRFSLRDWADGDHLRLPGAWRFSRLLASALAPQLRSDARPGCL